jgi:hypothetical protein
LRKLAFPSVVEVLVGVRRDDFPPVLLWIVLLTSRLATDGLCPAWSCG